MSRLSSLFAAGLFLLGGCSQTEAGNSQGNRAAEAAPSAPAAAPAAAPVADARQLAECAAKMDAMSRLYRAIASQSSGDEAADMRGRADQRSRAGFDLRMKAEDAERASGGAAGTQVARIISETEAALEARRASQPFDEFAISLGREADICAPLVTPGT